MNDKEEILREIKRKVIGIRSIIIDENDITIYFKDSEEAFSVREFNVGSPTRKVLELSYNLPVGVYHI